MANRGNVKAARHADTPPTCLVVKRIRGRVPGMADTLTLDPLVLEVRAGLARRRQTQEALANHLGLSRNAVVARLSGKIPFTYAEVRQTADFLGVSVGSLYGEVAA